MIFYFYTSFNIVPTENILWTKRVTPRSDSSYIFVLLKNLGEKKKLFWRKKSKAENGQQPALQ